MPGEAAIGRIAPYILRSYGISSLPLPFNVLCAYYFQAVMKPGASFGLSVLRGLALSGALIFALPTALGAGAIWFTMPLTELIVAADAASLIHRDLKTMKARAS